MFNIIDIIMFNDKFAIIVLENLCDLLNRQLKPCFAKLVWK